MHSGIVMSKIDIIEITASDWEKYKSLRLASLKGSPDSFGSSDEREVSISKDEWKSRISIVKGVSQVIPLFGCVDGVALSWGVKHGSNSQSAHIYQMWVSPYFRGLGIGKALINKIILWAKELLSNALCLDVTTTNKEAVQLYKSLGFIPRGKPKPLKKGSKLVVHPMQLDLIT